MRALLMTVVKISVAAAIMLAASCRHKDLCYDHTHMVDLRVDFDWSLAPSAEPSTMVLCLFPTDGGQGVRRVEFTDRAGGVIRIPAGSYRAVCHNGASAVLSSRGTTFDTYEIYTQETSLLSPMGIYSDRSTPSPTDDPVREAPETLWSDSAEGLTVLPGVEGQRIGFKPSESTIDISLKIKGVENLTDEIELSAVLTGLAETYIPSAGRASGDPVMMPFALTRTGETELSGELCVFGHCPDRIDIHKLTVYTSNKYYYNFDVTASMHEAEDPRHIEIVIEGLRLPDPDSAGMAPGIEDWVDEEREDIEMG